MLPEGQVHSYEATPALELWLVERDQTTVRVVHKEGLDGLKRA